MTTFAADAPAETGVTPVREPGKPVIVHTPAGADLETSVAWLAAHRAEIQAELHRSGAVLLRGLPVEDAASFAAARDALIQRRAGYKEKATPRTDFGEGVFSSTDLPAVQPIRLHNENSYTLDFPGVLLFGCVIAPEEGGATTVGDMREALRLLPPELVERFARAGWLLVRNYSELAGLPWYKTFATEDKAVAEAYCEENTVGYEWLDDDSMITRQRRSAIVTHPVTGEKTWFNHFAFWNSRTLDADIREVLLDTYGEDGLPFNTYLGDGTRLTGAEVDAINAVYDRVTVRETWQRGDLMIVDNILCAHGREAYKGDRKILVAMGEPVALADCSPESQPSTTVFAGE
ncbi:MULTISPECIES: TauD/TfdA family dioxygenase [unclassified Streptomyces]|uniref:TauD/TfdA family dioxygenase n=1 Tax=unclassified Streptomyces TaxID=2593676 RepID=UPI001BECE14B|nr:MULTISPECIES: TauD/TfdA family dioxygenase [unclassified Streptomyces]MBT2407717.1 TauD/TfdA family dioxygenase [Streptomyces sp. ISL-21]MBT2610833.1 TauD/TfdA family dioxygenase [Streptomyces sp. ISL-87]